MNNCSICGVLAILTKGMCKKHYDKAYRAAKPKPPKKPLKSRYRWVNNGNGQGIPVHQVIAARALGRQLPLGVEVHHVDGDGHNNAPSNLVICPSTAYHKLLHVRTAARDACGNANWLRCIWCRKYDDPAGMYLYTPKDQKTPRAAHGKCNSEQRKARYAK